MTKEEAFEAIAKVSDYVGWTEYRDKIMTILNDLDSAPTEFSVRELCKLIAATHNNHPDLYVELFGDGSWVCGKSDGEHFGSLRATLIELAKPPESKTAPCDVPIAWLKLWAKTDVMTPDSQLAKANAKVALERAGLSVEN